MPKLNDIRPFFKKKIFVIRLISFFFLLIGIILFPATGIIISFQKLLKFIIDNFKFCYKFTINNFKICFDYAFGKYE